jgi:hypothetical protein
MHAKIRSSLLALLTLSQVDCGAPDCGAGTLKKGSSCVPSYAEVTCAAGTHLTTTGCVADSQLSCGAGTTQSGDACVAVAVCGPGTISVEGSCVPDPAKDYCGPGTVSHNGICVAAQAERVGLPFAPGIQATITQASFGWASHSGAQLYAIDFGLAEGTNVAAALGGRVLATRADSTTNCTNGADTGCLNSANYIVIDHGDGTFGDYWHLQHDGVSVQVGDVVCKGDIIGLSGNTGFSTGPHLHFAVTDLWQQSMPLEFDEMMTTSDGIAFAGEVVTSANTTPASCSEAYEYSSCPREAYESRGVRLDGGLPCVMVARDQTYTYTGTLLGMSKVLLGRYKADATWDYVCYDVGADGRFSVDVTWPQSTYSGVSYMMWSAATAACTVTVGWYAAPAIYFAP